MTLFTRTLPILFHDPYLLSTNWWLFVSFYQLWLDDNLHFRNLNFMR